MAPTTVIEILEIFKDGGTGLGTSSPLNLVNEFELEAGKETFANRVVPAIAAPAHAAAQLVLSEQPLVIRARVLGGFKRSSQQNVLAHRPSHYPAREQIDNHRQIEPALRSPEIGHIGHPGGVGLGHG